uniref:Uncharacterized protein n=1 Tax=Panagrolaimus sp. PS1159 TaxID=55785 RepID=A0AC35FNB7_9BILA
MSYFLRHFSSAENGGPSTSALTFDEAENSINNTLLNLSTDSSLSHLQRIQEQSLTRECYSELLLKCAKLIYKNAILGNSTLIEKHLKYNPDPSSDNADYVADNLKYLEVIASPSLFGANFLALTTILKTTSLTPNNNNSVAQQSNDSQFIVAAATTSFGSFPMTGLHAATAMAVDTSPSNRNNHLITVGLDSIFSVLTELNKRDPELCAQALQQLLQLLQTIPPEGMIHESKQVITRMHDLLKTLRIEGNSTVSSYANACLVSLAIARGEPEMLFSAVKCLLCDEKENIPFNQLTSEFNPLPKNFQSMAFTVQKLVQNGTLNFDSYSFCNTPITDHSEFITFDLEYSGSFSSTEFSKDSNISKSCLNSDGSYLYILNNYGLFKVGTGLTETQTAKVLAVNEMLKFIDGSSLIICHESLYLRRKHSTRLWVIDKETLREIGEIMLHASLTDGILFSDGKCFYQGTLDEQWNFMVGFWVTVN